MDEFDEEILDALRDGKPHNFNQLQSKITFSHNTLRLHLDVLVDHRLIAREKVTHEARGRPTYVYSVSPAGRRASVMLRFGVDDVVVLPTSVARMYCISSRGFMYYPRKVQSPP